MTKRTAAKYKIDRRMGENIWGRPKSPVNRREYGPGQHGQRQHREWYAAAAFAERPGQIHNFHDAVPASLPTAAARD